MTPSLPDGFFAGEVTKADGREELIRVFARYRVVPKKNPMAGSGVEKSDYILERLGDKKPGGNKHAVGTQTRKQLIKKLGIETDKDCEQARDEIRSHPEWGSQA